MLCETFKEKHGGKYLMNLLFDRVPSHSPACGTKIIKLVIIKLHNLFIDNKSFCLTLIFRKNIFLQDLKRKLSWRFWKMRQKYANTNWKRLKPILCLKKNFLHKKLQLGKRWHWVPNLPPYAIPLDTALLFHKSFPNGHDLN